MILHLDWMQSVDFGGKNKIALGQAVDLVGPNLDFDLAPRQVQVGMVPLLFGNRAHAVDKVQGRPEIGEPVRLRQMMLIHHLPAGQLRQHFPQLLAFEWRDATPARHAMPFAPTPCPPPPPPPPRLRRGASRPRRLPPTLPPRSAPQSSGRCD